MTTVFTFDQYTLGSNFDSANLGRVEAEDIDTDEPVFHCWTNPDAVGTAFQNDYRTWFYFYVAGAAQGCQITIVMENMNKQKKMFANGMRPVYRVVNSGGESQDPPQAVTPWKRIRHACETEFRGDQFILTFQHTVDGPNQTIYFAFCPPYSYTELCRDLDLMEAKYKGHSKVYFFRELLCTSLGGRRVELLTISGKNRVHTEEREDYLPGLFPEGSSKKRPKKFRNKITILLSARVHPGETAASHMLNGFLDVLLDVKSPIGQALRHNFVFKVIPFLNPDGVSLGHYRTDTRGVNLNRCYDSPDPVDHVTIHAAREVFLHLHNDRSMNFQMYIDLHAHASKKGVFLFGNAIDDIDQLADSILYAKLMSLNCSNFDFNQCNFTEKNMKAKDKRDGASREGSGRVALYNQTKMVHVYTLESNYNTGKTVSRLAKRTSELTEQPAHGMMSSKFSAKGSGVPPKYDIPIWEDVGHAIGDSILDLFDTHPDSRMPQTIYKTVDGVRDWVMGRFRRRDPRSVKAPPPLPRTGSGSSSSVASSSAQGTTNESTTSLGRRMFRAQSDAGPRIRPSRAPAGRVAGRGKRSTASASDLRRKPESRIAGTMSGDTLITAAVSQLSIAASSKADDIVSDENRPLSVSSQSSASAGAIEAVKEKQLGSAELLAPVARTSDERAS